MNPEPRKPFSFKSLIPYTASLLYGLIHWGVYTSDVLDSTHQIVSWSFIALLPFTMGALTTFLGKRFCGDSNYWVFGAPIVMILIGLVLSYITQLEALLCVIVASPIMIVPALLGGVTMHLLLKKINKNLQVNLILLLPFLSPYLEKQWSQPTEIVTIKDSVKVEASASRIWDHIASVETIQEEELPFQWIYYLDFPKPLSAEIDKHEVGGIRLAKFERDVTFFEKVTEWDQGKTLSFSIHADPEFIPQSAFDKHIIVGGRFYDVLDGTYRIESKENHCILHLESTHRLSSPFNRYAGWWSEWVMTQIQGSILTVIKNRCEAE